MCHIVCHIRRGRALWFSNINYLSQQNARYVRRDLIDEIQNKNDLYNLIFNNTIVETMLEYLKAHDRKHVNRQYWLSTKMKSIIATKYQVIVIFITSDYIPT